MYPRALDTGTKWELGIEWGSYGRDGNKRLPLWPPHWIARIECYWNCYFRHRPTNFINEFVFRRKIVNVVTVILKKLKNNYFPTNRPSNWIGANNEWHICECGTEGELEVPWRNHIGTWADGQVLGMLHENGGGWKWKRVDSFRYAITFGL